MALAAGVSSGAPTGAPQPVAECKGCKFLRGEPVHRLRQLGRAEALDDPTLHRDPRLARKKDMQGPGRTAAMNVEGEAGQGIESHNDQRPPRLVDKGPGAAARNSRPLRLSCKHWKNKSRRADSNR
jgi:hypothetical protein